MTHIEQGRNEFETGRWSKAYRLFQQALHENEGSVRDRQEARLLMARCLAQLGEPEKAEAELKGVKPALSPEDNALLEQFEVAYQEVEDTKRLTRTELEERRRARDN
ncbi:MAG: tetratricopeptide repeat protein [Planctomycetes bacterium]|nr:tetratricopeptide repeat protein [Planctomycetota bacterium]MCW8136233.1 tetratricopeptide repeat protein [Planctomycetota bacterium]